MGKMTEAPNYSELRVLFDNWDKRQTNYFNKLQLFIKNFVNERRLNDYKEFINNDTFMVKSSFNIFKVISDSFYKENFHSDIIAQLLRNSVFLHNFIDLINDCKQINTSNYTNYEVKRNEKDIDILIKTETHAIIIENKINWATDQKVQLQRYYDSVKKDLGLIVDKVVYLVPNSSKNPTVDSRGNISDSEYIKIIGYDGEKHDFYTQCIVKSIEKIEKDNKALSEFVLASHYSQILKETGVSKMTKLNKEFYEDMVKTPENFEKAKMVAEMYNNLIETRINYYIENFGGKHEKYDRCDCFELEIKNQNTNIKYWVRIYINPEHSELWTWIDTGKKTEEKENLKKLEVLLKNANIENYFERHGACAFDFKFPLEEEKLQKMTEKLIDLLKKQ